MALIAPVGVGSTEIQDAGSPNSTYFWNPDDEGGGGICPFALVVEFSGELMGMLFF